MFENNKISLSSNEIEANSIDAMIGALENANDPASPDNIKVFGFRHPEFKNLWIAYSGNKSKDNYEKLMSWLRQKASELRGN